MTRILFALAVLSSAALAIVPHAALSQDIGPGAKGATLKQPWLDNAPIAPKSPGQAPSYLQGLLESSGASKTTTSGTALPTSLMPYDTTGINNDILVTSELGPWMILVASYGGPEGPMRGRQMVTILRGQYKLPAYVFNFGAEEKRKELARVAKLIEDQKAKLKKELQEHNLPDDLNQPIRVRHEKIEEYCGVLIGGYSSVDAATVTRDKLKKLNLSPETFTWKTKGDLLDVKFYVEGDPKSKGTGGAFSVHPFERAMPVPNPTLKTQRQAEKLDVAKLKHMNSEEDYSLFKCKKSYTLVIKQFNLPAQAVTRSDSGSTNFLAGFGLGKQAPAHGDFAAENAHEMAKELRKTRLEAYVLHMKYYSLVTIGGFDGLNDPRMRSMQNLLDERLLPAMASLQMFPKAMPMEIPH